MTTLELPWLDLYMGETHFFSEWADPESYVLQWHTAACTLYIVRKDHREIDLRIEREIYEIKYEDVAALRGEDTKTRVVFLRMHDSRPVKWARGTDFVPGYTNHAMIALKISIADVGGRATYEQLTKWLRRSAFTGATESISHHEAKHLWKFVSREIIVVDNDDEVIVIDENTPDAFENAPIILNTSWGAMRQRDIDRLMTAGQWANDEIVSFGMNLFLSFAEEDDTYKDLNLYLYSTYFYEILCKEGCNVASRFTKKVDLFKKGLLVYPVHASSHWFLVIIDQPGMALNHSMRNGGSEGEPEIATGDPRDNKNSNETKEGNSLDKAKLYILDSLPSSVSSTAVKNILRHLQCEAVLKHKKIIHLSSIEQYTAMVPLQPNSNDCGYYLLHFFFLFINDPEKYRKLIQSGRRKDADKNWNGSGVGILRQQLQQFIQNFLQEH